MSSLSININIGTGVSLRINLGNPQGPAGPPGTPADVLAYLQSLPTTLPSTPNMPYWDNDVFKRSPIAVTSIFRRPGGVDRYIRPSTGTYLRAS